MNYRHAYHAGNPADCVKHALFVALLHALTAKPKPLFVLDTHAGIGAYDLTGPEATKTGESGSGIAKLRAAKLPAASARHLSDYLALATDPDHYPGSPSLARAIIRPGDRLALCELHPDDARALKRRFHDDPQIHIHHRDGYEALIALLPPPERRALVLIDPPFENPDEFTKLATALRAAWRKFPTGVFAAWYPIKSRAPSREFHAAIRPIDNAIICELTFREPLDPARLNGCGMVIVNPPYGSMSKVAAVLEALRTVLGEPGAATTISRLDGKPPA